MIIFILDFFLYDFNYSLVLVFVDLSSIFYSFSVNLLPILAWNALSLFHLYLKLGKASMMRIRLYII
jgi:hypothetical protein